MKRKQSKELTALLLLAEKLMILENEGFEDDIILYSLLEVASSYLDYATQYEIGAIEFATYLPFRTNPELDNNDYMNVAFVEKAPTLTKHRS
jgi:hypothetical protein